MSKKNVRVNKVAHGYPQCNSIWAWRSSGYNDQRFHYGIDGLLPPICITKDVWEHQKSLRRLLLCPGMFKSERKWQN